MKTNNAETRTFQISFSQNQSSKLFSISIRDFEHFLPQNSYGRRGWRVLQQPGRLLRIRGGVREEELPRGGAFLPAVRSGRFAVGNGAESSQKGPSHFRITDHVTTVTGIPITLLQNDSKRMNPHPNTIFADGGNNFWPKRWSGSRVRFTVVRLDDDSKTRRRERENA